MKAIQIHKFLTQPSQNTNHREFRNSHHAPSAYFPKHTHHAIQTITQASWSNCAGKDPHTIRFRETTKSEISVSLPPFRDRSSRRPAPSPVSLANGQFNRRESTERSGKKKKQQSTLRNRSTTPTPRENLRWASDSRSSRSKASPSTDATGRRRSSPSRRRTPTEAWAGPSSWSSETLASASRSTDRTAPGEGGKQDRCWNRERNGRRRGAKSLSACPQIVLSGNGYGAKTGGVFIYIVRSRRSSSRGN